MSLLYIYTAVQVYTNTGALIQTFLQTGFSWIPHCCVYMLIQKTYEQICSYPVRSEAFFSMCSFETKQNAHQLNHRKFLNCSQLQVDVLKTQRANTKNNAAHQGEKSSTLLRHTVWNGLNQFFCRDKWAETLTLKAFSNLKYICLVRIIWWNFKLLVFSSWHGLFPHREKAKWTKMRHYKPHDNVRLFYHSDVSMAGET